MCISLDLYCFSNCSTSSHSLTSHFSLASLHAKFICFFSLLYSSLSLFLNCFRFSIRFRISSVIHFCFFLLAFLGSTAFSDDFIDCLTVVHFWSHWLLKLPLSGCCSVSSVICSSCIYHIRYLRRIRRHLDRDSAKLLVNALASSRLDYCNSGLSENTESDLTMLQRVLNCLACVVTKSLPFIRSVPLLRCLHWLPVKYRVHFKIVLLTYKALHEEKPVYFRSFIATSLPSRSQRSNRGITLSVPRVRTKTGLQLLHPFSFEQPSTICPFSYLSFQLQKTSQNTPFRLGLPP